MKQQGDTLKAVAAASDAVIGAAVLTGLGAWAGLYLDAKLGSSPWFALVLSLLGAGLGLARMVKKALDAEKHSEAGECSADDKAARGEDNSRESGSDSLF